MPYLNSAFNLASWLTRNNDDAQDVTQEACMRAFKYYDSFHGEDARSWLLAIVRTTFYTWYQANHERREDALFDEDMHSLEVVDTAGTVHADNNPETLLARKDSERLLTEALNALPLELREVIVLRELEGLSYKQIAGIVGIPIGTVMSRLGRGRKRLAKMLA